MSDNNLQDQAKTASTTTFITALVLNAAVAAIEIAVFIVLLPRFKAIYEPRTYIPDEHKRVSPLPKSIVAAPLALLKLDFEDIKRTNGLDAYVFVRFLRMMVIIFFPLWLLSWALFMPLHAAGVTLGHKGLDRFTFGNVAPTQQARYAAHVIFLYLMAGWIFWNIKREMRLFISARQRHLVDPEHSKSAQASTVLVTGVPRKFLDEAVLAQLFSHVPGGAKAIWLNRDLKEMPDVYDRQVKACNKLESAEKDLIQTAVKLIAKGKADPNSAKADPNISTAEQTVPRDKRPSHRLPPFKFLPFGLPLMGKKVDSIEWAREEIIETTRLLAEARGKLREDIAKPGVGTDETYPPLNSAFILFNQQIAAHLAAQSLTHNEPYRMADKFTEVAPDDVIWSNLGLNPYEQRIRTAISYGLTAGLIILWAFPVAFVGIVSNVSALCVQYSWLAWLCKIPRPVLGIIEGILPPVLLAVLMMLLPIILRLLARFEGIPRRTGLELSLMTRYFIFQVIHSFLIVSLAGGLIQALPGLIKNPSSAPTLLAQNLPSAATFFVTYILLQGLSGAAGGFLQAAALIVYYVKLFLLGSTPRSIYKIKYTLRDVAWGTLFPSITLITVIALVYTPLQPIVTGFACAAFYLFYKTYTYLFLYVLDQPPSGDTGGLFFPKAITHIFVGLYVQQICLAALFFLARNSRGKPSAIPEGALMIVLIVITAGYHYMIGNSYGPLLHSLPLSLAHKSYGVPKEPSLPSAETEDAVDNGGDDVQLARPERKATVTDERYAKAKQVEAGGGEPVDEDDVQPIERSQGQTLPTDFNHPASFQPQRPIWLPRDEEGFAASEAQSLEKDGIVVSMEHAHMNEKGKISIDGHPPGDMI